jgi:hypothetical protein
MDVAYLLLQAYLKQVPSAAVNGFAGAYTLRLCLWHLQRNILFGKPKKTLWNDVSIKSPKNGRGLMNYGLVFMGRASYDTANYYFTKALDYCPRYSLLHVLTWPF